MTAQATAVKDLATLTDDELIRLLRETVKGREDFVYRPPADEQCFYTNPDGQPGCVFGHALADYDISAASGERPGNFESGEAIAHVLTSKAPLLSSRVIDAAYSAQIEQDIGNTWGAALADFEKVLRREAL